MNIFKVHHLRSLTHVYTPMKLPSQDDKSSPQNFPCAPFYLFLLPTAPQLLSIFLSGNVDSVYILELCMLQSLYILELHIHTLLVSMS